MRRNLKCVICCCLPLIVSCTSSPQEGTEQGPCYPNRTCNSGLTCLSHTCVRLPGTDKGWPDGWAGWRDGRVGWRDGRAGPPDGRSSDGGADGSALPCYDKSQCLNHPNDGLCYISCSECIDVASGKPADPPLIQKICISRDTCLGVYNMCAGLDYPGYRCGKILDNCRQ